MRRFILAAAFLLMSLCFGDNLSAGNFGIIGGANFHTYGKAGAGKEPVTTWHAGLTYKVSLPVGFQIQPALLYNVKKVPAGLTVGCLELLASMQWGVDLILFRPFVEVCPFAGYGLDGSSGITKVWPESAERFEYGVGLGGGLQVWRFQVNARYNWNFGNMMSPNRLLRGDGSNVVTLSLAYFF